MKIGFIGLGRMGANMVLHIIEEGIDVVAYNRSKEKTEELGKESQELRIKNQESRILVIDRRIK